MPFQEPLVLAAGELAGAIRATILTVAADEAASGTRGAPKPDYPHPLGQASSAVSQIGSENPSSPH